MTKPTFNELKSLLEKGDLSKIASKILHLYLTQDQFSKNILLSGCLPEPLGRNFSEDKLNTYLKSCYIVVKYFEEKDLGEEGAEHLEILRNTLEEPAIMIFQIYKNSQSNNKRLFKNEFLKYPFVKQVQMLCSLVESQYIYSKKEVAANLKDKKMMTGLEHELPNNEEKVSISDNLEGLLEVFDTIIRLLHFNARGKIEQDEFLEYKEISPYNLPCIEELGYLAAHRKHLEDLWEKVKYQNWEFELMKSPDDKTVFYYQAKNKDHHKKEVGAVFRQKYHDFTQQIEETVYPANNLKESNSVKNIVDISQPETLFNIPKELFNIESNESIKLRITKKQIINNFGGIVDNIRFGENKDISVDELLLGMNYLTVLAEIYSEKSHEVFEDSLDSLKNIIPIFEVSKFIEKFCLVYDLDKKKGKDIINLLIFHPKPMLDLFSHPLIYVGNNRVILTPYLILQMNYYRIIEQQIRYWDIDVAAKGKDLEENLKVILNVSPNVLVNLNEIKFEANDGKMVEYDLIALFDNQVMLIEIKNLKRPFSAKEIYQREKDIIYGVEQVRRRTDILIDQWDTIKELVDIELPENPPKKHEVVKLVCTNIYNFSGRIYEGVYVTDFSALMKFFISPKVEVFELREEIKQKIREEIIREDIPNVEELKDYLRMPIALKGIFNSLEVVPRPIMLIEEDDFRIVTEDFYLKENPYLSYQ
ncbi:hypothetical protein [Priestia megaterium]|uniref:hypothetical protein n=1 Tax=Priestia megaterium TaxID=1404 RepID=UPI00203A6975|nr:hypothetical protein [Priestia megaterium]MCM3195821.1 hypothetical protein [Priestia megaterium]